MTLVELLNKLPEMTEDGDYFELRKQDIWLCVKTNFKTNKDIRSNIGHSPKEAVWKMLVMLDIETDCENCLHSYKDHVFGQGCSLCECLVLKDGSIP